MLVWGLNKRGECGLPSRSGGGGGGSGGGGGGGAAAGVIGGSGTPSDVIDEPTELVCARGARAIGAGGHHLALALNTDLDLAQ